MTMNFSPQVYRISDYLEWSSSGQLELSPNYQRRQVWSQIAKSYLIDTILRSKTMPKVLVCEMLHERRTYREVVDGQQRLRAIIEYYKDEFPISRTHSTELAGMRFSDLDEELQGIFLSYPISTDIINDASTEELLDTFARLNTYGVKLNKIELLHAQYMGLFRTRALRYGSKIADRLLQSGVLTQQKISRMGEVEFSAQLLVALLEGIKEKSAYATAYKTYDIETDNELVKRIDEAEVHLDRAFDKLDEVYLYTDIRNLEYHRSHLYYSLILAFVAADGNLAGFNEQYAIPEDTEILRSRLNQLSEEVKDAYVHRRQTSNTDPEFDDFISGMRRATNHRKQIHQRTQYILTRISGAR